MESTSLRIGNIIKVFPKTDEVVLLRVKEIHKETVVGEFYKSPGFYLRATFKDLNPVEFSDDWLIKAGFKHGGELWLLEGINTNCTIDEKISSFSITRNNKSIKLKGVEIIFLHQLQNLYSAISGDDLNIAYTG